VLANDSDVDNGTILTVADAGVRQGSFGSLTLAADGSYNYVLNNSAVAVQSLGAGELATDTFAYSASDGITTTSSMLSITIAGQNDIPVLAKPLSNQQLDRNTDVCWQIPADSFIDVDHNDTLSYSAQLANNEALPSWLKFDATTQTFSGHVPVNVKGSLDVQVTASDGHGASSVASGVFSISFGKDNPFSGRDGKRNDGPGSPGICDEGHRDNTHTGPVQSFEDRNEDTKRWGEQDKSGKPAYVDLKLVDQHHDALGSDMKQFGTSAVNDETDYFRNWVDVDLKISRMTADNDHQPTWLDPAHGADIGALAHNASSKGLGGVDAVSLTAASGTCLKGFHGLQEGLTRLG
jgi:VCBS repeat-containing protein